MFWVISIVTGCGFCSSHTLTSVLIPFAGGHTVNRKWPLVVGAGFSS